MAFPLTYKRKLVLPCDDPKEYSEKLLHGFCNALNKERKCKAELDENTIEFEVSSWDMMSWRAFSFIIGGNVSVKSRMKDVEIEVNLDTSLSAILILFLSVVFSIITVLPTQAYFCSEAKNC